MPNTQGYCEYCNAQRMLTAEDTRYGTIVTVLLICMLGPFGVLIVWLGQRRRNWRCAVCGTFVQAGRTNFSPSRYHKPHRPMPPEILSDPTGKSSQIGPHSAQGTDSDGVADAIVVGEVVDAIVVDEKVTPPPIVKPSEFTEVVRTKASDKQTIFLVMKGDVVRRLSSSELRAAVANGEFAPDDLIRRSDSDKWVQLSSVKGLDF